MYNETKLRAVMETLVDGIVTIDAEGNIQSFNPAAERIFGYGEEEVIGRNVKLLMPEPYHSEHDGYIRNYSETGKAKIIGIGRDVTGLRKDGTTFPMDLAVNEMQVRGERMFNGIVRDLTERKAAERALRAAKEVAVAATAANHAKSRFLSTMSHELRTPLNAIIGYSEILKEDAELTDDVLAAADTIHSSGQDLLALINDFIDLSEIEAMEMKLVPRTFDVGKMIRSAAASVALLVEKNGNTLKERCDEGLGSLYADETKVRQCVLNLLRNAAKFTQNGAIELAVGRETVDEREWVTVRVSDTGIGMSAEQVHRVFRPFAQANETSTRKYGGTGLGLAIVKGLSEQMGGGIEVESEEGSGSTFTLRLPTSEAPDDTSR